MMDDYKIDEQLQATKEWLQNMSEDEFKKTIDKSRNVR